MSFELGPCYLTAISAIEKRLQLEKLTKWIKGWTQLWTKQWTMSNKLRFELSDKPNIKLEFELFYLKNTRWMS